jgi:glycosyltransferase involved in cell wall biosynthesis|tara:strand:- start:3596 stop:4243 length:648 start_codon:yes stop_codon:yes gene_type:complete
MNILIIIPSYNDSIHLPELIQKIRLNTDKNILIIDDGSQVPILLNENNVDIVRNKVNLGKGAALKVGFKYAAKNGFSHAITMDSDLQHAPSKLNSFIEFDENSDLVYGRRMIDKKMPIHRRLSNELTSSILSMLCGKKIYDSQCGYRRYSIQSVLNLECKENGFQFESEILIKLSRQSANIGHVIIPTIYGDELSSIQNVTDTVKFIKLILGNLW